jgi:toxin secretion/phage lysis holin
MENVIKTIMATCAGGCAYFFGGADMWLIALVTVIVIDYVTGISRAYILSELSSKIGFKGIIKKLMYFAIVAVAVIADNIANAGGVLRVAVIGFLIANEALSILENYAAATGQKAPAILINILNKLKDDGDKENIEFKQRE